MKFRIDGTNRFYDITIKYHFKSLDGISSQTFDSIESFTEFMEECHPDIKFDDVSSKYLNRVELLTRLSNSGIFNESYLINCVHCFISSNSLIATYSEVGIREKMYEHYTMSEKVNDGYLHSFIAHNWEFGRKDGQTFVRYWYDVDNTSIPVYKVHCFKDKIVFEKKNGEIYSMIICQNYYIHYEGLKRKDGK
jgi:hypothetical protein